jgi:uncharacterized membrane protein
VNARAPKGLFLLLAVSAGAYFRHYYPLLPNIMASHFDARGIPNGWSSKQAFFELFAGMTLLAAVLVFGIPKIIAFAPRQLINLPNKEYWLSPEQWAASMDFLGGWFAWFGCAVYAVIVVAFDYAVQNNLHAPDGPNPMRLWYALAVLGVFTLIWTIRLFGRFGRVPRSPSS